jgi:hypothetical protein
MSWGQTPAGALYAIWETVKDNIDTELAAKNVQLAAAGRSYTVPTTIPDRSIDFAQTIIRELPQNQPHIRLMYVDRQVQKTTSQGIGIGPIELEVHVWLNNDRPSSADDLTPEMLANLQCMDVVDAVLKTLQAYGTGVYGKADGALSLTQEISQSYQAAYSTDDLDRDYTVEGILRLRLLHEPEYT